MVPALLLSAPLPAPVAVHSARASAAEPGTVPATQPVPLPQSSQDSLGADTLAVASKSRSDTVIIVKHGFDHREQIITGSVIMSCLMVMLVAMNNYNPR
jgi:hypothetical protein